MNKNLILTSILAGSLLLGNPGFAGNPNQSGQSSQSSQSSQSGQSSQTGQCGNHKPGFFEKIKNAFQKGYQAGKKAGTQVYDTIQNKVMDSGVAIKKAITGKKPKTFVKGHYKKDGTHVKGHFRTLEKGKK